MKHLCHQFSKLQFICCGFWKPADTGAMAFDLGRGRQRERGWIRSHRVWQRCGSVAAWRWRKNENPFFYNCPSGTKGTMSCSVKHKETSTLDSPSLCFDIYTCDVFWGRGGEVLWGGGVKASVLLLNLHLCHQWGVIELLATLGGKTVLNHHSFVDAGTEHQSEPGFICLMCIPHPPHPPPPGLFTYRPLSSKEPSNIQLLSRDVRNLTLLLRATPDNFFVCFAPDKGKEQARS